MDKDLLAFLTFILVLVVLFGGEPDLMDAIINKLEMKHE